MSAPDTHDGLLFFSIDFPPRVASLERASGVPHAVRPPRSGGLSLACVCAGEGCGTNNSSEGRPSKLC